jgi:sirohydrochlorin cobaltochelatase
MPTSAVILFAHGAREPEWARPFEGVRDRLRAQGLRVELAYLETMKPSLDEAARVLAAEGAKTVTVVPLFLAQGKHLKRELPGMIDALEQSYTGMNFRVAPALGDNPEILAAIASWVKRASGSKKFAPVSADAKKK